MNLDERILESVIILTPKAEAGTIHLKTRVIHAAPATDQRADAIQMNGNLAIGTQEMKKSSLNTEFVSFHLDDGSYENLHAQRLGEDIYLLDNSPFYTYGVSNRDQVKVKLIDGRVVFQSVERRGGHSTYRVKLPKGKSHKDFLEIFSELRKLGCTYEGTGSNERRLYAIDLPPKVNVSDVYLILEDEEKAGKWEFEEAHFFKGYDA